MDDNNKEEQTITDKQKEAFLAKFKGNRYHVTKTANDVGVHRNTILYWRKSDSSFKERYDDLMEGRIDDNEETLFLVGHGIPKYNENGEFVGWIEKPNVRALEILQKAYAKHRGYGDHIIIDDNREETHEDKPDSQLWEEIDTIRNRYDTSEEKNG